MENQQTDTVLGVVIDIKDGVVRNPVWRMAAPLNLTVEDGMQLAVVGDNAAGKTRLVEILNKYVLKDLPSGKRARRQEAEQYAKPHPEYFNLRIHRDGSVEQLKDEEL